MQQIINTTDNYCFLKVFLFVSFHVCMFIVVPAFIFIFPLFSLLQKNQSFVMIARIFTIYIYYHFNLKSNIFKLYCILPKVINNINEVYFIW